MRFKEKLKSYFDEGVSSFLKRDYLNAIKQFTVCLQINPEDSLSYFKRAKAYKLLKSELDLYKPDFDFDAPQKIKEVFGIRVPEVYLKLERHLYYSELLEKGFLNEIDFEVEIEKDINRAIDLSKRNFEYHLFKMQFSPSKNAHLNSHFQLTSAIECLEIFPEKLNEIKKAIEGALSILEFTYRKTEFDIPFRANVLDEIGHFSSLISREPNDPNHYFNRGLRKIRLNLHDKKLHENALLDFQKVISLFSKHDKGYNNLGVEMAYLGFLSKSILSFNSAIEISPEHPVYYNNRGVALCNLGQYELSSNDFSLAIELTPRADFYLNRAELRKVCGDFKGAENDYEEAKKIQPEMFFRNDGYNKFYWDPMLSGNQLPNNYIIVD